MSKGELKPWMRVEQALIWSAGHCHLSHGSWRHRWDFVRAYFELSQAQKTSGAADISKPVWLYEII
jgi:hypothetical protein